MAVEGQGHIHTEEDEELARLSYLQNVYSRQYEMVMDELANLGMAQGALQRNVDLLERKGSAENADILISGGAGTYIDANIRVIDKVMTYVGAGYLVEKSVADAKKFLSKNIAQGEERAKKLLSDKQKLEDELLRLQGAMEIMQGHKDV